MKVVLILAGIIILAGAGGLVLFLNKPSSQPAPQVRQVAPTSQPSPTSQAVDIRASFSIITEAITRNFSNSKYHNQSEDVYIEGSDPSVVYVKKPGITWGNFFQTLPMKLTKACLTTGDGETFCNQKDGRLQFFLNDLETPDLLDKEIKEGDKAVIRFSQ